MLLALTLIGAKFERNMPRANRRAAKLVASRQRASRNVPGLQNRSPSSAKGVRVPVASLQVSLALAALTGCSDIQVQRATSNIENGQTVVRVTMSGTQASRIVRTGNVIYIGLGSCNERRAAIYSSALVNGLNTSERASVPQIQTGADEVVLSARFSKTEVPRHACAFVKATSMSGAGGESKPVRISPGP